MPGIAMGKREINVHQTARKPHHAHVIGVPLVISEQDMDDAVGPAPEFNPELGAVGQIANWIEWSGKMRLARDMENNQMRKRASENR